MKRVTLKATLTATTLLVAASYGMTAQAHCIGSGSANWGTASFPTTLTLPSPNSLQYDKYITTCPAGATGAEVRISKAGGTAGLNITAELSKNTGPSGSGTTVVATDSTVDTTTACNASLGEAIGTGAGAFQILNAGAGTYEITVSKDEGALPAAKGYVAEFHCLPLVSDTPTPPFPPLPAGAAVDFDRVADH